VKNAERRAFAPARVNLMGEHTDYSGGLVLPVAVDVGTTVSWRPLDGVVRARSATFDSTVEVDTNEPSHDVSGWGRYVAALVDLLRERGRPAYGMDAMVESTAPMGAGLSSSAALTVSFGLALCRAASFELPSIELAHVAREAEARAVGVPCGLMDPAASLLARSGHALLLDCGSETYRQIALPECVSIVVVDSGVRRSLEHSGYSARRREVERAFAGADDDIAQRRLRHVVSENERVRRTVAALESDGEPDLAALGDLFREGHDSLREDFEVSTPELDLLVELSYDYGAIAARMTGGGFGGSVVVLAHVDEAERVGRDVVDAYGARTGRTATAGVHAAVDGAAWR
jgi:galactokinase